MQTIRTDDPAIAAQAVAERINAKLLQRTPVLWLLSGGSAIEIAVAASHLIKPNSLLSITLADERYGIPGHADSNYQQLQDAGFSLPILPVLTGRAIEREAADFALLLHGHLDSFIIGIFGMGTDGHTAGILPNSPSATDSEDLVCFYPSDPYYRITVTPKLLEWLSSAHLWVQGSGKAPSLRSFEEATLPLPSLPVRYLSQAAELVLYTARPI